MFANLQNGKLTLSISYRYATATVTDFDDLISAWENGSKETLTAAIDDEQREAVLILINN